LAGRGGCHEFMMSEASQHPRWHGKPSADTTRSCHAAAAVKNSGTNRTCAGAAHPKKSPVFLLARTLRAKVRGAHAMLPFAGAAVGRRGRNFLAPRFVVGVGRIRTRAWVVGGCRVRGHSPVPGPGPPVGYTVAFRSRRRSRRRGGAGHGVPTWGFACPPRGPAVGAAPRATDGWARLGRSA